MDGFLKDVLEGYFLGRKRVRKHARKHVGKHVRNDLQLEYFSELPLENRITMKRIRDPE